MTVAFAVFINLRGEMYVMKRNEKINAAIYTSHPQLYGSEQRMISTGSLSYHTVNLGFKT